MSEEIKINVIKGHAREIAERVDNANVKDGVLKGAEVSIFFADCQNESEFIQLTDWFQKTSKGTQKKYYDMANDGTASKKDRQRPIERCDATYVAPKAVPRLDKQREVKPYTHKQVVQIIADSWADKFNIDNSDGSFNEFVEKLYEIAKTLKITKTNDGKFNGNFPKIEDQIVDELMGAFANESGFLPDATSESGTYHGIFQLAKIGMDELKADGSKLPILSMDDFEKLTRIEQLDYMLELAKIYINDDRYSNIDGQAISPKQIAAMWVYPKAGDPNKEVVKGSGKKGISIQNQRAGAIKAKQDERGPLKIK